MANPWNKTTIGSWADEEEEEAAAAAAAAASAAAQAESSSFPSLKEAVSSKPKKNKKMSLTEFRSQPTSTAGGYGSGIESRGLTPDEMLRLPTAPRERSAEELQYGRLGGGFSSYGRSGPGSAPGRVREESDGSWGGGGGRKPYGGGFESERRGNYNSRVSDYDQQPSRADEVDNWAMTKKSIPSVDSGRQSRYPGAAAGVGGPGGVSRADEVDNWAANKKPTPTTMNRPSSFGYGSGGFGSGFRVAGPEPDRWGRLANPEMTTDKERPRLVLDPPKGDIGGGTAEGIKVSKPSPFGAARPREEVLAEKGLDWKKIEMEIEAKKATATNSRPTSAHSDSRPSSGHSSRSEGIEGVGMKTRPKVSPFGDAKPREVCLKERGQDWRKIDLELEHRAVERSITEEEKLLKEEIENLKKKLEKEPPKGENAELVQGSGGNEPSLQDVISQKERELEILILDLDDKVRFGKKAVERPGSGAGRAAGFAERPPSRSGSFDDSRSMESMDSQRPRSRGTQDSWSRPGDDRRGYQYGRDRRFMGSRDFDRSSSRERW